MNGYIGLGSNLGDPIAELRGAIVALKSLGVTASTLSSLYHTEPVDAPGQDWYVNAVAEVRFDGDAHDLLRSCQSVEAGRGRKRLVPNAPRTLDLDVLLLGDVVLSTEELTIPHPRLHRRRFVLVPLVEIAPALVHPVLGVTMRALLEACPDDGRVLRLEDAFA